LEATFSVLIGPSGGHAESGQEGLVATRSPPELAWFGSFPSAAVLKGDQQQAVS